MQEGLILRVRHDFGCGGYCVWRVVVPQPQELYFAIVEYAGIRRTGFPDPKFGGRARRIYLGRAGSVSRSSVDGRGLGADGFYIYQNLPDWIMTMVPEIASQLSPTSTLYPNAKNLYVRLLAETGLIGFVLFLGFPTFHSR